MEMGLFVLGWACKAKTPRKNSDPSLSGVSLNQESKILFSRSLRNWDSDLPLSLPYANFLIAEGVGSWKNSKQQH
jgi:hypothetical protein